MYRTRIGLQTTVANDRLGSGAAGHFRGNFRGNFRCPFGVTPGLGVLNAKILAEKHLCWGSLQFLIRFRTLHYRVSRRRHRSRRCVFKQVKLAVHERARFRGRAQPDAIDIPSYGPARSCGL